VEGSDRGDLCVPKYVCVVWMLGGNVFGWLVGGCVSESVWVTKRDKARGSDEIIMCVSVICAYTAASARVGGYVCVCVCVCEWQRKPEWQAGRDVECVPGE